MQKACSIVLAAGEGTRMRSNRPKVLLEVLLEPMLKWVLDSIRAVQIEKVCVVTGYKNEYVSAFLEGLSLNCETVVQSERRGTAHAVLMAEQFLRGNIDSDVLILNGDAPFVDAQTIRKAYEQHKRQENAVTVISAKIKEPFGYGRILRAEDDTLVGIVEQKDASDVQQKINEVNSGAYWFDVRKLLSVLRDVRNENVQQEYYLTDTIELLLSKGERVDAYISESEDTVLGANSREQLNELNKLARAKVLNKLIAKGVDIPIKDGIIITKDVLIGQNTRILPGCMITGDTVIGTSCIIGPNTYIEGSLIGNDIKLNTVHCVDSRIITQEKIRPFSVINDNKFV